MSRKGAVQPGNARQVVELFAGVGGLRLGLERGGWQTVWANQWEPSTKRQHAFDCYVHHFGEEGAVNEDINLVLNQVPPHDLLVGGFPCQDYSVAKTLNQAHGIEGKKGVLWWAIHKILHKHRPRHVLLENVDRLLKSPATQRGRDFAIILASLSNLGYLVEWRVVNAADYGFPQRRRRVFVVAHRIDANEPEWRGPIPWLYEDGVLARALPVQSFMNEVVVPLPGIDRPIKLAKRLDAVTDTFGLENKVTPFFNAGVAWKRQVWTRPVTADYDGPFYFLRDVLQPTSEVPKEFFVPTSQLRTWRYLKGGKSEDRTAANGHPYTYSEGAVTFPDPVDAPSRTILTGEGGTSPSRFKHVVRTNGRLRRLTPLELERLNGFPDEWTNTGMPDGRRAFMMGNALVVGLVERVGKALVSIDMASGQVASSAR